MFDQWSCEKFHNGTTTVKIKPLPLADSQPNDSGYLAIGEDYVIIDLKESGKGSEIWIIVKLVIL